VVRGRYRSRGGEGGELALNYWWPLAPHRAPIGGTDPDPDLLLYREALVALGFGTEQGHKNPFKHLRFQADALRVAVAAERAPRGQKAVRAREVGRRLRPNTEHVNHMLLEGRRLWWGRPAKS
jgi:hypothetical protein